MKKVVLNIVTGIVFMLTCFIIPYYTPQWFVSGLIIYLIVIILMLIADRSRHEE